MAGDPQGMCFFPARHFEKEARQVMNASIFVRDCFARSKRRAMWWREAEAVDRFHALTSMPVSVWKTIPEIFAKYGEETFREAETDALRSLRHVEADIIVTGGGIVLRDENVQLLRALAMTIWLHADEEILWQRASRRSNRPLLQTPNPRQKFSVLLQERLPLYQATADHRIDTSSASIAEVVDEIATLL